MNILMLSDSFPPRIGGMERYVSVLSGKLSQRNHKVTVCTSQNGLPLGTEEINGVKVVRSACFSDRLPFAHSDPNELNIPPIPDPSLIRTLEKLVAEEKPDVINIQGWILYSLLHIKSKISAPVVVTLHDYRFFCPKTTLLRFGSVCNQPFTSKCFVCSRDVYSVAQALFVYPCVRLQREKLGQVDKIICVSSFVRQVYLEHLGIPSEKMVTIPNFYSGEKPSSALDESSDLPEDFVLYVGLLDPFKGTDVLVKAYERMNGKAKLVLIGKKGLGRSYKSSKNIFVFENASDAFVKQAYSRCRFVVVPSVWPDPCPTVAFEAMACKKAIVASAIGGLTDIVVDGQTGILVPPNDSISLERAIVKLSDDESLAKEMGESGRKRYEQYFNANIVVPRIETLYESLL